MDAITKSKLRDTFKSSRTNMLIASSVAIVVLVAGFTVVQLRAAGFFATVDASQATASTNAKIINDSTAYGGKAVQFTAPEQTPPPPPPAGGSGNCALPNYPNASCTGVPAGTSLTAHNGDYTAKAGEVVSGKRITGKLFIGGNNVIIRNSEIHGEVKNNGSSNNKFTVEDSLIGPPSGCKGEAAIGHNNYTLTRIRLRGFGEGPRVEHGGNVVIRDSLIKLCDPGGDAHSDGIQGYIAGSNVTIEHNTIDQRPVDKERVTSPVFWSDNSAGGMLFRNNLLAGGGYTIRIHSGSGHTVTGNKAVNNSWYFGPVSSNCGGISWSGNSLVEVNSNYQITKTIGTFACKN